MGKNYLIGLSLLLIGCNKFMPELPVDAETLAGPIENLTEEQLLLHISGDEEFARVFGSEDGLGPIFVQNSCESCHIGDGKGSPLNNLTRFGQYDANGIWDPMISQGGPQIQNRALLGHIPESVPDGASSSEFLAPNVTGLGYLALVPDEDILALADPNDENSDGISGIPNLIEVPDWVIIDPDIHTEIDGKYIGRFGRKGGAVNLMQQTVNAYREDMGVTSKFSSEDPVNYITSPLSSDNVPDPEINAQTIDHVVFYLMTLKAPPRRNTDDPSVQKGESIFSEARCNACHISELKTGSSEIQALNQVKFNPYTDLLFHDLGTELDDNYTEGSVGTNEWKTTPLWGLGLQKFSQGNKEYYMHDGRATSLEEAIMLHGGEAEGSREYFKSLSNEEKKDLYNFLNSL